jgi:hypothetical protein
MIFMQVAFTHHSTAAPNFGGDVHAFWVRNGLVIATVSTSARLLPAVKKGTHES